MTVSSFSIIPGAVRPGILNFLSNEDLNSASLTEKALSKSAQKLLDDRKFTLKLDGWTIVPKLEDRSVYCKFDSASIGAASMFLDSADLFDLSSDQETTIRGLVYDLTNIPNTDVARVELCWFFNRHNNIIITKMSKDFSNTLMGARIEECCYSFGSRKVSLHVRSGCETMYFSRRQQDIHEICIERTGH